MLDKNKFWTWMHLPEPKPITEEAKLYGCVSSYAASPKVNKAARGRSLLETVPMQQSSSQSFNPPITSANSLDHCVIGYQFSLDHTKPGFIPLFAPNKSRH